MEKFIENYAWIAMLLILIVEFLIGSSKLKSNSTIELVLTVIKFVFGLDKAEEKKE